MTKTPPSKDSATNNLFSQFPCIILMICQAIGHSILSFFQSIGAMASFVGIATKHTLTPRFYPKLILKQFIDIGYYSLPVVGMTALFTGMVLALQSYTGFTPSSLD